MGGYFSGGGRNAAKESSMRRLDMADLKRLGMLQPGGRYSLAWFQGGEKTGSIVVRPSFNSVLLEYKARQWGDDWQEIEDRIPLAFSTPNYGGRRTWFVCPSCGKRKRVLWGGTYFRCAKCYGMVYDSQYEDRASRLIQKSQKVRMKLGGDANLIDWFPPRPKRMRRKTYERLLEQDFELEDEIARETIRKFGMLL